MLFLLTKLLLSLKSNMDRFIVFFIVKSLVSLCSLKSNMDRFIGEELDDYAEKFGMFKIQYG